MGRGPQDKIYKKLISKYLKFDVKRSSFNSEKRLLPKLISAYKNYGFDHPESNKVKREIEHAVVVDNHNYNKVKGEISSFPSLVSENLYNLKHKAQFRGKHHVDKSYYYEIKRNKEKLDF